MFYLRKLTISLSRTYILIPDLAQDVLQMSRVWHDAQHEDVQRLQQTALLWSVSKPLQFLFYPSCRLRVWVGCAKAEGGARNSYVAAQPPMSSRCPCCSSDIVQSAHPHKHEDGWFCKLFYSFVFCSFVTTFALLPGTGQLLGTKLTLFINISDAIRSTVSQSWAGGLSFR